MAGHIHVADVGTTFTLTLMQTDTQVFDLSGAGVSVNFVFQSASKRVLTVGAVIPNGGADGVCQYSTQSGDLDAAGGWKVQAVVTKAGALWHSDIINFQVLKNIQ
jgi:hypothetical protein